MYDCEPLQARECAVICRRMAVHLTQAVHPNLRPAACHAHAVAGPARACTASARAARHVERGQRRLRGHDAGAPAGHSVRAATRSPGFLCPRASGAQPRALPGSGRSSEPCARPRCRRPRPVWTSAPRACCASRWNRRLRWRRWRPLRRSGRRQGRHPGSAECGRACRRAWRRQCAGGGARAGAGRPASLGAGGRAGSGSGRAQAAPARARGAQAPARRGGRRARCGEPRDVRRPWRRQRVRRRGGRQCATGACQCRRLCGGPNAHGWLR